MAEDMYDEFGNYIGPALEDSEVSRIPDRRRLGRRPKRSGYRLTRGYDCRRRKRSTRCSMALAVRKGPTTRMGRRDRATPCKKVSCWYKIVCIRICLRRRPHLAPARHFAGAWCAGRAQTFKCLRLKRVPWVL